MKKCPICSEDCLTAEDQFCRACGADLTVETPLASESTSDEVDLDFTVTETLEQDPQTVDPEPDAEKSPGQTSDPTAETKVAKTDYTPKPFDTQPIGISTPPPPPNVEKEPMPRPLDQEKPQPQSQNTGNRAFPGSTVDEDDSSSRIVKKADEDALRHKIEAAQKTEAPPQPPIEASQPAIPAQKSEKPENSPDELATPRMASRSKGVAFYYKNLIQLAGHPPLSLQDKLIISDREYELRPRQIDNRLVIGSAAAVFAVILIFVASMFVSGTDSGQGQIFGVVLDQWDKPYVGKSEVQIADQGIVINPDAQGFFRCSGIPTGAHEVQYRIDGKIVGREYATVVDGELTMLYLRPSPQDQADQANLSPDGPAPTVASQPDLSSASSPTAKPRKSGKSSGKNRWASLTLAANVDNARLVIDGQTLGAGNLTFSKLTPGEHRYEVSQDGYQSATGTIKLKGGQTRTLGVELERLTDVVITPTAQDCFYDGLVLAEKGDYPGAILKYDEAVRLDPGHLEAYQARAATLARLGKKTEAHDDYIRVAEICRAQGNSNRSVTAYNKAIELDERSLTALLGRGDLYLAKGQEIAALHDFEAAREIDNNDYRAHFGLGRARFQQTNFDRAVKHFKDARKADESQPIVYQYLMLSYLAVDDDKKVRKSFEKFAEIASTNQMQQFQSDERFAAVLQVVNNN